MGTMQQYAYELGVALRAVHRASVVTKNVMQGIDWDSKSDATPVTVADLAAQVLLICAINQHFPDDRFVAKESGKLLRQDPGVLERVWTLVSSAMEIEEDLLLPLSKEEMLRYIDLGSRISSRPSRAWILDPISGTAAFVKSQQYAVSLCLTVNGEQKVAAVGCPNLQAGEPGMQYDTIDKAGYGVMVYATAGCGAFICPQTMEAIELYVAAPVKRPEGRLDISQLRFTDYAKHRDTDVQTHRKIYKTLRLRNKPMKIRCQQMRYIALALGTSDAQIRTPPNPSRKVCVWDHAGGQLIYQEAGGKVTDMYGNSFRYFGDSTFLYNLGLVAADEAVHGPILLAVQEALRERCKQQTASR